MNYVLLIGRILFSLIFIFKGLGHFSPTMIHHAEMMGVPMAVLLVPVAGILSLLGGLSILLGYKAKIGAWLLVIFLVPAALFMHQYWNTTEPAMTMMQHYCFWKNVSMIGAALMISYFGSGPLSLDRR